MVESVFMKRVLFLMSDTGGGHRAAAEAIRDALIEKYGAENISATLVDVFRLSAFPMNYMPEIYSWFANHGKLIWGLGFKLSNTRRRAKIFAAINYLTNRRRFKSLFINHPADVVVSVHSIITSPTLSALHSIGSVGINGSLAKRPPHLTVVTDLVTTHHFWYDKRTQMCLVPTQEAYDKGIRAGLSAQQLRLTGLPVDPRFVNCQVSKEDARTELGWRHDMPTILLIAGGDGMGAIDEIARSIDLLSAKCQIVIVAGRNGALKERLDNTKWQHTTHVYPFVSNMPTLMAGADILVTKAGPATITEAAIAGLPMILSDVVPGQEDGNVTYVVENNAGVYAPAPHLVAKTVENWLSGGQEALNQLSSNAKKIANPNAVWEIADEVWKWAHVDTNNSQ